MILGLFNRDKVYLPTQQIGDYTVQRVLGEGRYGICYLVSKDKKRYILKQLKRGMLKKIGAKVKYEEEILKSINHECIPKFIKKIELNEFGAYILEFKQGKTFEEIIFEDNYIFKRDEIYNIGIQLINILKYLHHSGIVHRDIRVPNVLYNQEKVYLVDFGLARWIDNKRYAEDIDFSYLGDFLLHLYYTSFEVKDKKEKVWYEELDLPKDEEIFLKRLMGIDKKYNNISEVEEEFLLLANNFIQNN